MANNSPGTELSLSIEPGSLEDAYPMAIVQEEAVAWRDLTTVNQDSVDVTLLDLQQRLGFEGAWSRLAVIGGELVGFVLGHPSSSEPTIKSDSKTEYLARLMVLPDHSGEGVGGLLLGTAAQIARARGRKNMVLWVAENNLRARDLYARLGYYPTGKEFKLDGHATLNQYSLDLSISEPR